MGAWSHEPFGNDDACDFAGQLSGAHDLSVVEKALDAVLRSSDYLEADTACVALAAVEVLAKLRGRGTQSDAYTAQVDAWVGRVGIVPPAAILQKAGAAIERILAENSELRELWEEGEDGGEWKVAVMKQREALGV